MKKLIVCIAGKSGVGKTYLANALCSYMRSTDLVNQLGCSVNILCSHTTRPQREGERPGIDHWFDDLYTYNHVDSAKMLAYTRYGEHHYWTSIDDLTADINIYVIDEPGIECLAKLIAEGKIDAALYLVRVSASKEVLAKRGIDEKRQARDPESKFRYHSYVHNDYLDEDMSRYFTHMIVDRLTDECICAWKTIQPIDYYLHPTTN